MADTGLLTFTNVGQLTDGVNTSVSWTNLTVSNLNSDNGVSATYQLADGVTTLSKSIRIRTISNPIPSNVTITGYEVKLDLRQSVGGLAKLHRLQIVNNSVALGNNKSNLEQPPTVDTLYTFGGNGDLWGTNLTPADVNGAGFGIEIQFQGGTIGATTVRVDLVQIKIYYSTSVEFTKEVLTSINSNQEFSKNTSTTLNASELFTKSLNTTLNASEVFINTINTAFNSAQMITKTINTSLNALSEISRNISLAFNSLTAFNKNQELQLNSSELFQRNVELQFNASMAWIKNVATSLNSLTAFTQNIVTVFLAGDFVIPTNPNDVLPVKNTNPHVKIDADGNITPLKVNKIIDFSNPNGIIVVTDLE